jgi:hypothetical protein
MVGMCGNWGQQVSFTVILTTYTLNEDHHTKCMYKCRKILVNKRGCCNRKFYKQQQQEQIPTLLSGVKNIVLRL